MKGELKMIDLEKIFIGLDYLFQIIVYCCLFGAFWGFILGIIALILLIVVSIIFDMTDWAIGLVDDIKWTKTMRIIKDFFTL